MADSHSLIELHEQTLKALLRRIIAGLEDSTPSGVRDLAEAYALVCGDPPPAPREAEHAATVAPAPVFRTPPVVG